MERELQEMMEVGEVAEMKVEWQGKVELGHWLHLLALLLSFSLLRFEFR